MNEAVVFKNKSQFKYKKNKLLYNKPIARNIVFCELKNP